jgi:hypothetical protein
MMMALHRITPIANGRRLQHLLEENIPTTSKDVEGKLMTTLEMCKRCKRNEIAQMWGHISPDSLCVECIIETSHDNNEVVT